MNLNRREIFRRSGGMLLGAGAVAAIPGKAKAATPAIIPVASPLAALKAAEPLSGYPNDVTTLVRNWFVNRNPVLSRFPWSETTRSEFYMYSHQLSRDHPMARGLITTGTQTAQWCQKFQHPAQICGLTRANRVAVLPGGVESPFGFDQTMQLQNMVDDIEVSMYYSVGGGASNHDRPRMRGLANSITTNRFKGSNPSAKATDLLDACRAGGGFPDLVLMSSHDTNEWVRDGYITRGDFGKTAFGVPINGFRSASFPDVHFVECPLLVPKDVFCLTSCEIYVRNKVSPRWDLRGPRGDMVEGDWVAELSIDVVNEQHHAAYTNR